MRVARAVFQRMGEKGGKGAVPEKGWRAVCSRRGWGTALHAGWFVLHAPHSRQRSKQKNVGEVLLSLTYFCERDTAQRLTLPDSSVSGFLN